MNTNKTKEIVRNNNTIYIQRHLVRRAQGILKI